MLISFQKNPVGNGSGKYKGDWLFRAKRGYASLLPILGIMKYEEFYGTQTDGHHDDNKYFMDTSVSCPRESSLSNTLSPPNTNTRVQSLEDQVWIQQQQIHGLQEQLQRAGQQRPPSTLTTPLSLHADLPPSYEQCMSVELRDANIQMNVASRPEKKNL